MDASDLFFLPATTTSMSKTVFQKLLPQIRLSENPDAGWISLNDTGIIIRRYNLISSETRTYAWNILSLKTLKISPVHAVIKRLLRVCGLNQVVWESWSRENLTPEIKTWKLSPVSIIIFKIRKSCWRCHQINLLLDTVKLYSC